MIIPENLNLGFTVSPVDTDAGVMISVPIVREQTDQKEYNPGPVDLPGWLHPGIKPDKYAPLWYEIAKPEDMPVEEPGPEGYIPFVPNRITNRPESPCREDSCVPICNYGGGGQVCAPCESGQDIQVITKGGKDVTVTVPGTTTIPGDGTETVTPPTVIAPVLTMGSVMAIGSVVLAMLMPILVKKKKK